MLNFEFVLSHTVLAIVIRTLFSCIESLCFGGCIIINININIIIIFYYYYYYFDLLEADCETLQRQYIGLDIRFIYI